MLQRSSIPFFVRFIYQCITYYDKTRTDINKGKGAVFHSLISSLKSYHRTLHFTPWSLDLFIHVSFQLPGEHTVLQPFQRIELIVHIAIAVLPGRPYSFSPESSEAFEGEVSCPRTHHLNNVPRLRGGKHDISLKILHQAGFRNRTAGSDIGRAPSSNHCAMSLYKSTKH